MVGTGYVTVVIHGGIVHACNIITGKHIDTSTGRITRKSMFGRGISIIEYFDDVPIKSTTGGHAYVIGSLAEAHVWALNSDNE